MMTVLIIAVIAFFGGALIGSVMVYTVLYQSVVEIRQIAHDIAQERNRGKEINKIGY